MRKLPIGIQNFKAVKIREKLKDLFFSFFASIPYEWYTKNNLSSYEGFYASIVYTYFTASGIFGFLLED